MKKAYFIVTWPIVYCLDFLVSLTGIQSFNDKRRETNYFYNVNRKKW